MVDFQDAIVNAAFIVVQGVQSEKLCFASSEKKPKTVCFEVGKIAYIIALSHVSKTLHLAFRLKRKNLSIKAKNFQAKE